MKKYFNITILLLYFVGVHTYAQNKIQGYKYWFNNDYSSGVTTTVTPAEYFDLSTSVPTSGLNTGIHTFNIQFWDDSLEYSSPLSRFFFIKPEQMVVNKDITTWQYWFDDDFENAITQSISQTQQYDLSESLNVNDLNAGIHIVNVRFKDNTNTWSTVISQFFFIRPQETVVNKEIMAWQYWMDNDFENATTQTITPSQQFSLMENLDVNDFNSGIHTVNIRFKDNTNTWSSVISQFFFIRPQETIVNKEIMVWQYWMDNDFENATTQSIIPNQQFSLMENLDVHDLNSGIHRVNIRFKDNTQTWSSTLSQFFFIRPEQTVMNKKIIAWQYWIDNDFENSITQNITPAEQLLLADNLDLNDLNSGIHTVNFRFRDNSGVWSTTLSNFIFKKETINISDNEMITYRYWFDEDFEFVSEIQFNPTGGGVTLLSEIDMTQIWKGDHTIHFQFLDSYNQWSVINSDTVTKNSLPIAEFEYTADLYCDSTVLTFSNLSIDGDEYLWEFGDGNVSEDFEPVYTYFEPGDYSVSLTVTDTILGIDSTQVQLISIVSNVTTSNINPVECDTYTSPSGNYTWTSSGVYMDTIPNTWGCDSIITVDLTILSSTFASITETACDSYNSPSGIYTWSTSGTFMDTISNATGCDSVITVDLTIYNSTFATLTETACDSYTSPSGYYTWTSSGTFMDTIQNNAGCDSVITVDLTIYFSALANITETACFSYTSPSGNYIWTESGNYIDTIPTVMGCDSILNIDLTINTVDTTVSVVENTLTANAVDATYQWLNCEGMLPISGETNQSFTPIETGLYAVEVTQNDCVDTSSCYQVVISGFDAINFGSDFTVYPNPTNGFITIDLGQEYKRLTLKIMDYKGELIRNNQFHSAKELKLELEGAKGLYFIDIKTAEGKSAIIKVVKE